MERNKAGKGIRSLGEVSGVRFYVGLPLFIDGILLY